MKVKCIDDSNISGSLILGKIYFALNYKHDYYSISDEQGMHSHYYTTRFVIIEDTNTLTKEYKEFKIFYQLLKKRNEKRNFFNEQLFTLNNFFDFNEK